MARSASSEELFDWAIASRAVADGECGDLSLVVPHRRGVVLAVVDGLGHGSAAATAARRAGEVLRLSPDADVGALLTRCHDALQHTRAAAMALASVTVDNNSMRWLAVGSVQGFRWRTDAAGQRELRPLVVHSGLVGDRISPIKASTVPLQSGDVLIMATDGVRRSFGHDIIAVGSVQATANHIIEQHSADADDALVLVARYH